MTRNRVGASDDPCGIPRLTVRYEQRLPCEKAAIDLVSVMFRMILVKSVFFVSAMRRSAQMYMLTRSNAFLKSMLESKVH